MSRRIVPRRICDPVQIVPEFSFTAAQRRQMLDAFPCVRGEESEFIAGLERCARTFLWSRNQYRDRWTQAEQNAALTNIGQLAEELAGKLLLPRYGGRMGFDGVRRPVGPLFARPFRSA